jgi:aspartate kinase
MLAKNKISVDLIIQSIGKENKKDISFTVSEGNLEEALKVLDDNKEIINARETKWSKDVSKVSIVGAGMVNNSGVAATMFEALYDAHINIHMIATSEIKISVLVDRKDAERAVAAIHDKFNLA